MTEEIKTCNNNQKMYVYCKTCVCKSCEQIDRLKQEQDRLKAELHSKVEFIQEQRTIIDEYAKEIEIYKQCQGKRASKREEELKQGNKELIEDNLNLCKENRELKIYIESNKQQVEDVETLVMDNDRLQQEVENLKDVIYYDVEKYRSALEEIREMFPNEITWVGQLTKLEHNIYNKINEVLGNE